YKTIVYLRKETMTKPRLFSTEMYTFDGGNLQEKKSSRRREKSERGRSGRDRVEEDLACLVVLSVEVAGLGIGVVRVLRRLVLLVLVVQLLLLLLIVLLRILLLLVLVVSGGVLPELVVGLSDLLLLRVLLGADDCSESSEDDADRVHS
ncbi:hypothetical protein PENTCL1PPCAC_2557, partial [Pristionchus entomophagus]